MMGNVIGPGPFTFAVRCRPAPQGSKTLVRDARTARAHMRESSSGVKPFRNELRRAATGVDGRPRASFVGPVVVAVEFEFVQPKSNTDDYPTAQNIGDIDKLTRAVLDGLTEAGVIEDDRLVVGLTGTSKRWGDEDRAIITVMSAATAFEPMPSPVVDFAEGMSLRSQHDFMDAMRQAVDRAPNPFDEQEGT